MRPGDNGYRPTLPRALGWLRRRVDALRARDIGIRALAVGPDRVFVDTPDRYAAVLAWKLGLRDGGVRRLIARQVMPGMVAVDVGANVGCYTIELARRVGTSGRVYALEPEAHCFELLGRAVGAGRSAQVELRHVAAADYSGWTTLYLADVDQGDHRVVPADSERHMVTVRAVSLDDVLADAPRVDFVKLAVQGAEVAALRGLRRTLARNPALGVLCTIAPALLERAGSSADALFDLLSDGGRTPHRVRPDGVAEAVDRRAVWSLARARGRLPVYFRRR